MEQHKEYFAFISYKREDEDWAKWLAHELEHYHLPLTLNGRDDLPKDLRPIFRDIDELSAGNLPQQIHRALERSKNLIVVCSPRSAGSPWVNKEVEEFINMGKLDRIFPFIIEGIPYSKNEDECLPEAIRNLSEDKERLGANVSEYKDRPQRLCVDCPLPKENKSDKKQGDINDKGRDAAVVKIVAGMLDLDFDLLWQRYEKEKAEEERRIKEQRDNLLKMQSRFLAEKVIQLTDSDDVYTAQKLALNIIPQKTNERPYVPEAEFAFRHALKHHNTIIWKSKGSSYLQDISVNVTEQLVAIACEKVIYVVRINNGQTVATLRGHNETVTSVSFTFDENLLISASEDKTLRLWNVDSGKCLKIMTGHTRRIQHVACSHENTIASASWDNTIRLWNSKTGECFNVLEGHERNVVFVSFDSSGSYLVSASNDHSICIWDVKKGTLINSLKDHRECAYTAVFSNNGRYVASSSEDNTIIIWDIRTNKCIKTIVRESVKRLLFSPDDTSIVIASSNSIRIWDYNSDRIIRYVGGHQNEVSSMVAFSHFGKLLSASYDGTVRLWELATVKLGIKIGGHKKPVYALAYSPDGSTFASGSDSIVRIWDVATNKLINEYPFGGVVRDLIYNKQGTYIISCSEYDLSYRIYVYDINRRTVVNGIDGLSPLFLSDGVSFMYIGNNDFRKCINIQKVNQDQPFQILKSQETYHSNLVVNEDESLVASGTYHGTVDVWDINSGEIKLTIKEADSYINAISFGIDGNILVFSCKETTYVIDINSNECIARLRNPEGYICQKIQFIDDLHFLCCYHNGDLLLWNYKTRIITKKYKGHSDAITSISVSNDKNYFVSASKDKTIKIWDYRSGMCKKTLCHHTDEVKSVVLSPNGKQLISGSIDHSILIWDTANFANCFSYEEITSIIMRPFHDKYVTISPRSIKIWDYTHCKCQLYLRNDFGRIVNVNIFPNESIISVLSFEVSYTIDKSGSEGKLNTISFHTIHSIWDIKQGVCLNKYEREDPHNILFATFMPKSNYILFADKFNRINVWDTKIGKSVHYLFGHTRTIKNIIFDKTEKFIASSSIDGTTRIWKTDTGDCINILDGCSDKSDAYYLEFHPHKSLLLSSCENSGFKLWDFNANKCLLTYCNPIKSSAGFFSPDGNWILIQDKSLKHSSLSIWDISSKRIIKTIEGRYTIKDCLYSPITNDLRNVVTIQKELSLSDYESGTKTDILNEDYNLSVSFSPDNRYVVCLGSELVTLLKFKSLETITKEVEMNFHNVPLNSEERKKFYLD